MLKHYLTAALRHFGAHKLTTAINVVCLTIGLVCFLAIYATIAYISRGDSHYPGADRIFMLNQKTDGSITAPTVAFGAAKYLRTDVPELESVARILASVGILPSEVPITSGDTKTVLRVTYADPEVLQVFVLPFLAGDSREALRPPRSAIISKATAIQLYGDVQAALGKVLRLQDGREITVRGVIDKLKQPSHMSTDADAITVVRFDVLLSMDVLEAEAINDATKAEAIRDWQAPLFATYAVLPKDGSLTVEEFRNRLSQLGPRHADTQTRKQWFTAIPVSNYLLNSIGTFTGQETTGVTATALFYFLGVIVLFASCLNYANLATAQAATRAKEIGMRRVVGARTKQVMAQFIIEAAMASLVALGLALVLVVVGMLVARIDGINTVLASVAASWQFWSMLGGLLLVVTICAGAYPAFVLSRVRPTQAMHAAANKSGGRFTQRVLVAVQFATAAFLVITVLAMQSQNAEFRRLALSEVADPFVLVANNFRAAGIDYEVLRTELSHQPHIQAVTASLLSPWVMIAGSYAVGTSPDEATRIMHTVTSPINLDFFDTLGMNVLAGRVFDRASAQGSTAGMDSVVLSRALAREAGWTPDKAVGKTLYHHLDGRAPVPLKVIGVVEDRPMGIITVGANSSMYLYAPSVAAFPIIRVSKLDRAAAIREIEQVWSKLAPNVALRMHFADEIVARSFQYFDTIGNVFSGVALLAFCISVLGLIGLSLHVIGRRRHEIGIRKTLGASVRSIVVLLLKDFSIPILIANVLAWPVAFLLLKVYVSIFTQRTALSIGPFIAGLAITVTVAWIAVAAQATRAARLNPARVLRYE
jgi:putative ABC transport system permease protein